jgi:hypothetical protein
MLDRFLTALEHDTPRRVTHIKQLAMLQELVTQKAVSCTFVYADGRIVAATKIKVLRPQGPLSYPAAVPEDFYKAKSQGHL